MGPLYVFGFLCSKRGLNGDLCVREEMSLRKLNEHTSAQNLNAFVPYFKIEGTGYKIRVAIATAKVTSLTTLPDMLT